MPRPTDLQDHAVILVSTHAFVLIKSLIAYEPAILVLIWTLSTARAHRYADGAGTPPQRSKSFILSVLYRSSTRKCAKSVVATFTAYHLPHTSNRLSQSSGTVFPDAFVFGTCLFRSVSTPGSPFYRHRSQLVCHHRIIFLSGF